VGRSAKKKFSLTDEEPVNFRDCSRSETLKGWLRARSVHIIIIMALSLFLMIMRKKNNAIILIMPLSLFLMIMRNKNNADFK
jgi:hypothetical protein